jgi:hypothetical protein
MASVASASSTSAAAVPFFIHATLPSKPFDTGPSSDVTSTRILSGRTWVTVLLNVFYTLEPTARVQRMLVENFDER